MAVGENRFGIARLRPVFKDVIAWAKLPEPFEGWGMTGSIRPILKEDLPLSLGFGAGGAIAG